MAHRVIAPCVVIKGVGYHYKGAIVPAGADEADLKRLTKEGFLEEFGAQEPKPAEEPKPAARSTAKK